MHSSRALGLALSVFVALAGCSVSQLPGGTTSTQSQSRGLPSVTSPGPYQPRAAPRPGGTIRIGSWQFPSRFSPYFGGQAAATPIEQAVFDGLLASAPNLDTFGDLAEAVPTLENGGVRQVGDGMDVTYQLRAGLAWSDGQPITPDDVIFTFQAITVANLAVGAGQEGYELITSVERAGSNGVVLHFRSVFPAFRNLFSAILPRHRLQGLTPDRLAADTYWSKPDVVSGAFLVQDVARDHV